MSKTRSPLFFLLALMFVFSAKVGAAEKPKRPYVFDNNFPKAIFYRYANNFDTRGGADVAYKKWSTQYGRMMGVELDDRVTTRNPDRSAVVKRFKKENPGQMLLYYGLGMAAHVKDAIGCLTIKGFDNGHWVYYPRARVTKDIRATKGNTEISVDNPKRFNSFGGRRSESICIYSLKSDGTPDWKNAEQVELMSINNNRTITVQRGQHGTKPRSFKGKKVYAAPHATVGIHPVWWFNFSKFCPKGKNGKTASDLWVKKFSTQLKPGGPANHFDGLQLDTMAERVYPVGGRPADINNDGIADNCDFDGINEYAVGVSTALNRLRLALPKGKVLVPDAANRSFFQVNGFEFEGFPERNDPEFVWFSKATNFLDMWKLFSPAPQYNHVQHKMFGFTIGKPDNKVVMHKELPMHLSRLSLATSTCHLSAITWYSRAPKDAKGGDDVYDEIRMGAENKLGWLGQPTGKIIYPALNTPNILSGKFPKLSNIEALKGSRIDTKGGSLKIAGLKDRIPHSGFKFTLTSSKPDLFLKMRIKGKSLTGVPLRFPRIMEVTLSGGKPQSVSLFPSNKKNLKTGWLLEDGTGVEESGGISTKTGIVNQKGVSHNSFTLNAMAAKSKGGKNAVGVYWQRQLKVKKGSILSLWFAKFSNLTYRIEAAIVDAKGKPGKFVEILEPTRMPYPICWLKRTIKLDKFGLAGKDVVFRMINNLQRGRGTGVWGEVALGVPDAGDNLPAGPTEVSIESYFTDTSYNPSFYFSSVPVGVPVTLTLEFEGGEEVTIEKMTAHAGSGALVREFEKGAVLVNPAPRPATFDLKKLFPGKKFRRLRAVKTQDTRTNNGKPIGDTVRLGKLDGLFMVKE